MALPPGGLLYLYGPFICEDMDTAPSNQMFDASLKARDARWGLRSVEAVEAAAVTHGLMLDRLIDMPAHNLSLLLRRRD